MDRAYILHTRPYTDSKLIANLLVEKIGRVDAVVRHTSGKHSIKGILQPFQPLYISLSGKSDLKNISQIEAASPAIPLKEKSLYSSIYLNELIMKTIYQYQGDLLFESYHASLLNLANEFDEAILRYFEINLLKELGEKPNLKKDIRGDDIVKSVNYIFEEKKGFLPCANSLFTGEMLLELETFTLSFKNYTIAKKLCRILLSEKLQNKTLISRELFSLSNK